MRFPAPIPEPNSEQQENYTMSPTKTTKDKTNTYLKITIGIITALTLFCLIVVSVNAIDITDYRTEVLSIVSDQTLDPLEKNIQQAELFGWGSRLAEFMDRVATTDITEELSQDGTEVMTKTVQYEPNLLEKTLYFFGLAEEPMTDEEGAAAWDAYLTNYMANYQGSYIYAGA